MGLPLVSLLFCVAQDRPAVDAAVERGAEYLISKAQDDGTWPFGMGRPGADALIVYTLLKSGIAPDHEAISRALEHLALADVTQTYDTACLILALAEHDARRHRDWIEELAELLMGWQNEDGDWGYPSGADLSNTQFAALGLRTAARAGVEIPLDVWTRLSAAVLDYESGRGFGYHQGGGASISMTAAGVGTLAIASSMLSSSTELSAGDAEAMRRARKGGVAWLADKFERAERLQPSGWSLYALYGLERVGAFEGLSRLEEFDWYREGATALLDAQRDDGGWEAALPSTCFALLFLRRASLASKTRDGDSVRTQYFRTSDAAAPVQLTATGDSPLTIWISGFGAAALAELEWPGEKGQGPHVRGVEYLVGKRVVATIPGDPAAPLGVERFAYRHSFRAEGTYAVQARVHAVGPRSTGSDGLETEGRDHVLWSPPLEVVIDDVVPGWLTEQRGDHARNLLRTARARAKASSNLGARNARASAPENAIDGRSRTAWYADPDDDEPTLTIRCDKAPRANVILVSHPRRVVPRESSPAAHTRALEIEVRLGGKSHVLRMFPDERRKGRLVLESPVLVSKLELAITWKVPGEDPAVGIGEVELQLVEGDGR